MKGILIPVLIFLLVATVWAGEDAAAPAGGGAPPSGTELAEQKAPTAPSVANGAALLDMFIENMRALAAEGTSAGDLDKRLQEMMMAARKAQDSDLIDPVFFFRFNRMLAITKLVIVPDATGILAPVIDDVLDDFVLDKLGRRDFREAGGKGPVAINAVAQALSVELINLQIYLDTAKEREELEKKLSVEMSQPPKK